MSREIKFKGKRLDNGEWVYGYLRFIYIDTDKASIYDPISVSNYDVLLETVGQYTGVKDKNGKEIYEGDILIVVTYSYKEPLIDTTCVVEYDNKYCLYNFTEIGDGEIYSYSMIEIGDSFKYELEVIGNIYENPELLVGDNQC